MLRTETTVELIESMTERQQERLKGLQTDSGRSFVYSLTRAAYAIRLPGPLPPGLSVLDSRDFRSCFCDARLSFFFAAAVGVRWPRHNLVSRSKTSTLPILA